MVYKATIFHVTMASIMTTSRKRKHSSDSFLECSLCSDPYDNDDHKAKLLPCLHTFCKSCLQNSAGDDSSFDCQKCCKTINLPGGTVDSLPDNFLVENLKQRKAPQPCGNCDRGNPAVKFCEDCDSFQCKSCVENHSIMHSLKNHNLSTVVDEFQTQQGIPIQQECCKKHDAQPLKYYCKEEKCQVLACALCSQEDHQNHDIADLELTGREAKTNIKDASLKVKDKHHELQNKRDAVIITQKNLTSAFKAQEAEIEKSKNTLQDLINSSYSRAQSKLKHLYDGEMRRLNKRIKSMDSVSSRMSSACEFTDKACDVTPPAHLLTYSHQITTQLQELENKELPEIIFKPTKFTFTGMHHHSMNNIKKSLDNLCDTDWKRQVDPGHCTFLSNELEKNCGIHEAIVQTADRSGENLTSGGVQVAA